jgi:hypothetical protein
MAGKEKNMSKPSDTIVYLEIEKSKICREKSKLIMDKSIGLYVIFMFIGVVGFIFNYIDSFMLNTLIFMGITVLVIGTVPYMITVHKEEKKIDSYIKELKERK